MHATKGDATKVMIPFPSGLSVTPDFVSMFRSLLSTFPSHFSDNIFRKCCAFMRDTTDSSLWLCIQFEKLTTIRKPHYLTKLLSFLPVLYPQLYPTASGASSPSSKEEVKMVQGIIEDSGSIQASGTEEQSKTTNTFADSETTSAPVENDSVDEMDSDDNLGSELSFLYSCLSMHPIAESISSSVSSSIPSFVLSQPFPHQILALSWMMQREGCLNDLSPPPKPALHPLFSVWPPDPTLYVSPWTAVFTREFIPDEVIRKGGVLCDTMGLGKTFEMILLILMHPRDMKPIVKTEIGTVDENIGMPQIKLEAKPARVQPRRNQRGRKRAERDELFVLEDEHPSKEKRLKQEPAVKGMTVENGQGMH